MATDIKNIEGLTVDDINKELDRGAKFIYFSYTISILVMTFRRSSSIYFVSGGESHWSYSWKYTLISLLFGWWGIPWGFIYTPMSIISNISGGKDVTQSVLGHFNANTHQTDFDIEPEK
ncbi:MAG: hypothetical protein KA174_10620 [Chitinophagales bacterium]|nr:hypothetical protein [Chitinophagales bacterium]